MGESTHGTHQFQDIKIKTFKYLVSKGFNVFGLEANYSECEAINQYILTGEGNSIDLLKQLQLWPWKTAELAGLIRWMRAYNANVSHKNKLEFFGFDSGNGIFLGIPALKKLMAETDQNKLKKITSLEQFEIKNKANRDSIQNEFIEIRAGLIANKDDFEKKIGPDKFNVIIRTLTSIIQNYEYYYLKFVYLVRDRHMSENISYMLAQNARKKIFVFAHNAHINYNPHYYEQYGRDSILIATKTMGYYLKTRFMTNYQAIGLDFLSGRFRVNFYNNATKNRVDSTIMLGRAPEKYLSAQVLKKSTINSAVLYVKNRCTTTDSIILHNYGGAKPAPERSSEKNSFKNGFDALLIFRNTSATTGIN